MNFPGAPSAKKPGKGPLGALPGPDEHDTALVRLGAPGVVRRVVVDTAHFTGNYPASASVEGLRAPDHADVAALDKAEAAGTAGDLGELP